jgi:hypothetical protein
MKLKTTIALVILLPLLGACSDAEIKSVENKKSTSSQSSAEYNALVKAYVGKKVPYEQYGEIGMPETLIGTDNNKWVAYFPKGNFTIVSDKKSDMVKAVYIGKQEQ